MINHRQYPEGVEDTTTWVALKELDEQGENLTSWEINFVESLTKQLLNGHIATPRQLETLDDILDKRVF